MAERTGGFNQKAVTIHKTPVDMKKDSFLCAKREVYRNAMQDLNGNAFKLWLTLEDNQNNYHFYLSTKYISEMCGFSTRTAQNCIDTLIEKGYLILIDTEFNEFLFYDVPPKVDYNPKTEIVQKLHN